jgi:chromosomal replication initiation ATPase DnaA
MCCGGTGVLQTPEYSSKRMDLIVRHVSSILQVPVGTILGRRRTARIAWARHVCCWLARELTDMEFQDIGDCLGEKSHKTIRNSVKIVDDTRSTRPNSWETRDTTNLRAHLQKLFTPEQVEPEIAALPKAS